MLPLLNMQAAAAEKKSGKQQQLMAKVSISILVMSLPVLYVSFLHIPPATLFRDTTFWFLMSNSIIIVIAADSGMLFFRSSSAASVYDDDRRFVVSGELIMPMAVVKNDQQAMVVSDDVVSRHALVAKVQQDDGVVKPEETTMMLIPYAAAPAYVDAGEAVVVEHVDGAMVPGATPRLTASRSLADKEESTAARRRRTRRSRSHSHALVPVTVPVQDKSVVVREEKVRRTATEGRRPPPAPEETTEYSHLSDEELNRRVEEFIARFNMEMRLQLEKEQAAAA